jgi:general secretion pathway protein G
MKKGFTLMRSKGFTLIELLVVISLIGILSTLVVANMNSARERARDAQRKSDLRNIQTGLRLYYNDENDYPATAGMPWGSAWTGSGGTTYMNILPMDPLSPTQDYVYSYTSATDNEVYTLYACLENKSDDKCVLDATACPTSSCKYLVQP